MSFNTNTKNYFFDLLMFCHVTLLPSPTKSEHVYDLLFLTQPAQFFKKIKWIRNEKWVIQQHFINGTRRTCLNCISKE